METIQLLIDALMQLLFFSFTPFIWWFMTSRKETPFFDWLALKKPTIINHRGFIGILLADFVIILVQLFIVIPLFINEADLSTSQFSGRGLTVLLPALIYAVIQTGLAEEVFFRGFLAKRFIHAFGMQAGTLIQATLFGLLHGLIFFNLTSLFGTIVITFLTGLNGWLMGLLNEKYANGSITPSWIVHALSNILSSLFAMYL